MQLVRALGQQHPKISLEPMRTTDFSVTYPSVMMSPIVRGMLLICARKQTDTARNMAVPSMLMVPMGRMNLVTRLSALIRSSNS